jgi:hypothetical protein
MDRQLSTASIAFGVHCPHAVWVMNAISLLGLARLIDPGIVRDREEA